MYKPRRKLNEKKRRKKQKGIEISETFALTRLANKSSAGIDTGTIEKRASSAIVERPLAPELEGASSAIGESWRPVHRRPEHKKT